jgi:small subunit ribosomal protein S6
MRAYEVMVIVDAGLDDGEINQIIEGGVALVQNQGGTVANIDRWGRRRFAYEIDHKTEGYYAVLEIVAEHTALDALGRSFRLSDGVVRHKIIRLPDDEAARRGLAGDPAGAGTATGSE